MSLDPSILRAMQAGAKTYLTKSVQRDELIRAIRAVAAGDTYLPSGVANRLAERLRRLIEDETLRGQLAARARASMHEYDEAVVFAEFHRLLARLAKESQRTDRQ